METNPHSGPPGSKEEMVRWIQTEHDLLEGVLARLSAEQMLEPALEAGWSAKDIMAHISAWEGLLLNQMQASSAGQGSQLQVPELSFDAGQIDSLNERRHRESKDRPLPDVRRDFNRSFEEVLTAVEATPEADLLAPKGPTGDALWERVAANTYWHYREHRGALESWLSARASDGS